MYQNTNMRNYLIYAAFTATANNAASTQIVKNGTILGVQWAIAADLDSSGETYALECSLVPTFQSRTNESQGVISAVADFFDLVTSGGGGGRINAFFPVNVPVQGGQLVYLNGILTTTTDVKATCILTVR